MVEDKKKTTAKKSLAKKSTTKKTTAKVAGAKKNAATKKIEKAPILVDIPRMKKIYTDEVVPVLKKEFG